ncbi:NrfD/PsrC family molybdoenzyme membrane anchor subunit, partial [Caenispirillum bisanense]|uniref:NrfD/PsrC family molybdoenzyme membrane anchor subunit n=1 Tax=Caenispirillum bisanense TaxID=414052 RepID=UPI0031E086D8
MKALTPHHRRSRRDDGDHTATAPTYYDQPALKPPPYDWRISGYMVLAGIAGSAQIISTLASLSPHPPRRLVRNGRLLGLIGTVLGTPLLIADLKTPSRFYNMLRIARPTSAMSIGSWILSGFGGFSGLVALGQLVAGRIPGLRRLVGLAQVPAAGLGAGMSVYTASLLSATSIPLWSAA